MIADTHVLDAGSHLDDDPCRLVAENDRERHGHLPRGEVEVGVAHAHGRDPELDLAVVRARFVDLVDPHIPRPIANDGLHAGSPPLVAQARSLRSFRLSR